MLNRKSLLDLFPQRVRSLDVPIATALRKTWAQGYDAAALRADLLAGVVAAGVDAAGLEAVRRVAVRSMRSVRLVGRMPAWPGNRGAAIGIGREPRSGNSRRAV